MTFSVDNEKFSVSAPITNQTGTEARAVRNQDAIVAFVREAWNAHQMARPLITGATPGTKSTPVPQDEDIAVAMWTSGSTGKPKLIPHTRTAMEYQAAATLQRMAVGDPRLGVVLKPGHAYGYSLVNIWLHHGGDLSWYSPSGMKFLMEALLQQKFSSLDAPAGVWRQIIVHAGNDRDVLSAVQRLKLRGIGGQLLSDNLYKRCEQLDIRLHDGYGLTEAGPNVSINSDLVYRGGTVGTPLSGTEVRVENNELMVKSPSVSSFVVVDGRFEPNPSVDSSGWLHTGDVAVLDENHLRILGRLSTEIHQHGMKISLESLESSLSVGVNDAAGVYIARGKPGVTGDVLTACVFTSQNQAIETIRRVEINRAELPRPFTVRHVKWFDASKLPIEVGDIKPNRSLVAKLAYPGDS